MSSCLQYLSNAESHEVFGGPATLLLLARRAASPSMEAAARLLVESTEADVRACQNALDTVLREQRQHRADRPVSQQPSPSLGVSPRPSATPSLRKDDSISRTQRPAAHASVPARRDRSTSCWLAADHRVTEAEAALGKARGRAEMARALAALPADAGDEDIVDLSEPYDPVLHEAPAPVAVTPAAHKPLHRLVPTARQPVYHQMCRVAHARGR